MLESNLGALSLPQAGTTGSRVTGRKTVPIQAGVRVDAGVLSEEELLQPEVSLQQARAQNALQLPCSLWTEEEAYTFFCNIAYYAEDSHSYHAYRITVGIPYITKNPKTPAHFIKSRG